MAAKIAVILFAVLAVAAAEQARVKKQVVVGAYDDGSYFPGKYEGTGLPYAYPYAAAPYAAAPYAGYPYAGYPYAAPYAAASYVAPVAAAVPYAAAPVVVPVHDDGSYFPGKYGPETQ